MLKNHSIYKLKVYSCRNYKLKNIYNFAKSNSQDLNCRKVKLHGKFLQNNSNNTIFIFQLMIYTTTYKILEFIPFFLSLLVKYSCCPS